MPALSEIRIRNAKSRDRAYKLFDELGLFLLVMPSATQRKGRLWRLRYRYGDVEKLLSLGAYPDVSLKRAREKRDEARRLQCRVHSERGPTKNLPVLRVNKMAGPIPTGPRRVIRHVPFQKVKPIGWAPTKDHCGVGIARRDDENPWRRCWHVVRNQNAQPSHSVICAGLAWITMAPPGLNIGVPGWWRARDALIEL